jgi:AraC family transcriptional regulator
MIDTASPMNPANSQPCIRGYATIVLCPKSPRGGLAPYVLRRIEHYLDERLPESVGVADLAKLAGLSVSHFSREFKHSLGIAPSRFILKRRLTLAAEQVVETSHPLALIALDAGFSDQSHFTRSFTRTFGMAPREFRRNYTALTAGCEGMAQYGTL